MAAPKHWKPMQRAELPPLTEAQIEEAVRLLPDQSRETIVAALEREAECEYWLNDIYQVAVERAPNGSSVHMNIRRRDGKPIFRDWRHFQQIKNEIVGEECEAVELYPAESRLVDSSNKYHLWASTDPTYRFPFGFNKRDVSEVSGDSPGYKQRKFG